MTRQCVLVQTGDEVEGEAGVTYAPGKDQLERELVARSGDFLYIPSGVPHGVMNASDSEPAVAVLARTDANGHEDVTQLPQLDDWARRSGETLR